jgi:hypothetical protein
MSHLKLVRDEPPKPPRRKGERRPLLSPEEERQFRQAMRNLRDAFGSTGALCAAMGAKTHAVNDMLAGRNRVSGDLVVRAMRALGLSLAELLGGPIPADRCRACGQIKRGRAA